MLNKITSVLREQIVKRVQRSSGWSALRKEFLLENPTCAACGKDSGLQVHHIEPFRLKPELELDKNNLITLCDDNCHILFGHLRLWRSYNKHVVSDARQMLKKIEERPTE